eukprot:COSAG01_NODE_33737_length_559_cov_1.358696_1_plen_102_part_10
MKSESTTTVEKAISNFRRLYNEDFKNINTLLQKDKFKWTVICSCMDYITNTELAIKSYAHKPVTIDNGDLFLFITGLFQSFIMQQDAIKEIIETLTSESGKN